MAFIAIKTMTPIYASSGQVVIKVNSMRSQLLDDPRARYGGQYGDMNAIAYQEMNLLLTSHEFLDQVVRELNLAAALRSVGRDGTSLDEEEAIAIARGKLSSMIRLKSEGNRLFSLEVRDPDPSQAHRLAKVILDRFVNEYRASQTASNTSTRDFLARQLEVYQGDLQTAENELNSYQAGLASAALVDNSVNALNIGSAEAALSALRLRFDGQDAAELRDLAQSARKVTAKRLRCRSTRPTAASWRRCPSSRTWSSSRAWWPPAIANSATSRPDWDSSGCACARWSTRRWRCSSLR